MSRELHCFEFALSKHADAFWIWNVHTYANYIHSAGKLINCKLER